VRDRLREVKGRRPIRQDLADLYEDKYAEWLEENDEVEPMYEGDVPKGAWREIIGSKFGPANIFARHRMHAYSVL
jgi:hypothetical protein